METFVSTFSCKECFRYTQALSPKLVDSGYAAPFDGKCPICGTIHSLKTGEVIEDKDPMTKFVASSSDWQRQPSHY